MSLLRSLPRTFIPGARGDGPIAIPEPELVKLRKVLRLSTGAEIAVLPDDGSLIRCRLEGRSAEPIDRHFPDTESAIRVTIGQALPKGDKLDEIVRACTELGVAAFVLFESDRTVVRWDDAKALSRLERLRTIAREAAEVSFRTRIPTISLADDLAGFLSEFPSAVVLSEAEGLTSALPSGRHSDLALAVGPEGGWSPDELALIGDRGVTLGPRVLRVDHAAAAACAAVLVQRRGTDVSSVV